MRFEVRYSDGPAHEVELQGSVSILGRDPSCDLVLHDVKCSRRHAVIEAGPDGAAIRDTGSANGVYLNGRKVERSALRAGDEVRLGDVVLKLLADNVEGTVIMGPSDLPLPVTPTPIAAPVAPAPSSAGSAPVVATTAAGAPAGAAAAPAGDGVNLSARPITVTLLAGLWVAAAAAYAAGGLMAVVWRGRSAAWLAAASLLLAGLGIALAYGLWILRPWARVLQIAAAAMGLLVCPFTLASAVSLAYLLAGPGTSVFGPAQGRRPVKGATEMGFAGALAAAVLIGGFLTAVAAAAIALRGTER